MRPSSQTIATTCRNTIALSFTVDVLQVPPWHRRHCTASNKCALPPCIAQLHRPPCPTPPNTNHRHRGRQQPHPTIHQSPKTAITSATESNVATNCSSHRQDIKPQQEAARMAAPPTALPNTNHRQGPPINPAAPASILCHDVDQGPQTKSNGICHRAEHRRLNCTAATSPATPLATLYHCQHHTEDAITAHCRWLLQQQHNKRDEDQQPTESATAPTQLHQH